MIVGNMPISENYSMTLFCHAESLSQPVEYRYLSEMEFRWSGNYSGTGRNITIGPLDRTHNGNIITCTAKEVGTSDSLCRSNNSVLNIQCKFWL